MDKAITVSKTYRVTMTAAEHKAIRVLCANNDIKASELVAKYFRRLIAKENKSILPVGALDASENNQS